MAIGQMKAFWEFAKKCYKMRKAKENGYVLPAFFLCRYMVTSNNMRFLKTSAEFQYMDFFDEYNSTPSIMLRQKTYFHLTQLTLAQRIAQLKGNTVTGQKPELVPEYFKSELVDPFSGEPYLWDAESGCFYGVGPDREDDQNSLTYDPTNGIISAGDISIP